ncbi:histidine kinase [Arcicella sp. DC2W]|uniref:Histidine kinase n=1 Tax=Arcicella gelida TaxID=2984195 RepID=A0ABU5S3V1_9BACT|nr:histidine kinase [Arcicella sp. DC2W]MEA5402903.1 histidine kinase [Arcicella sp. DC2W]
MKKLVLFIFTVLILAISCNRTKDEKLEVESYSRLIFIKSSFDENNLNKVKSQLDSMEKCCYENFSATEKAYFHYLYSNYFSQKQDERAEGEIKKSESFASNIKNQEIKVKILIAQSYLYLYKDDLGRAFRYILKAKEIEESSKTGQLANIYSIMGMINFEMQNFKNAISYYTKCITYTKSDNYSTLSVSYYYLALCLINLKEYPQALFNAQKALYFAKKSDVAERVHISYIAIAGVFTEMKKTDSALYYFELDGRYLVAHKMLNNLEKARLYSNIGETYISLNKIDKAISYLKNSEEICRKVKVEDIEWDDIRYGYSLGLERCYLRKKAYKLAYYHNKKAVELLYKRQTKEHDLKVRELEGKYNIGKKQNAINKLQTELTFKNEIVKQQYIIMVVVILLGISGVLLFYLLVKRRKLEAEKEHIELEQRLLLSQMNPHFMFNALSAIQKEIILGNTKIANLYLTKYADLMRLILENSRQKYINVEDELLILEHYLSLQKIRFSNRFDYRIEYTPELKNSLLCIPPMLIQPFIENSIEHGFSNINYQGFLKINFQQRETQLVCTIDDNGQGEQSAKKIAKNSHSTSITRERLNLLSKETGIKSSLNTIKKEAPDLGFHVTITIPLHDS